MKIKLTIEINPVKFFDTHVYNKDGKIFLLKYVEKKQKFQFIGLHNYLRDAKEIISE